MGKLDVKRINIVVDAVQGFASLSLLFFFVIQTTAVFAEQLSSKSPKAGSRSAKEIILNAVDANGAAVDLPMPPSEIAEWIDEGKVRFEFYDPKITRRSFAGETEFEFQYTYKSRSSWKRKDEAGKPGIEISIQYHDIALQRSHRVLLPQEMICDDLFDQRLTLHEFDHVRISADPRLPALLASMLQERNAVVTKVLDEEEDEFTGKPSPQDLARISKRLVKNESDRVFTDFVAVVSIRYRELDRVSNYGLEKLSDEDRDRIIRSAPTTALTPAE